MKLLSRVADIKEDMESTKEDALAGLCDEGIRTCSSIHPFEASCATERNAALRSELEAALRSNEMHRLILEAAGEGIYGLDADGLATFANPAAEAMT